MTRFSLTKQTSACRGAHVALLTAIFLSATFGAVNAAEPDKSRYTLFNPTPDSELRDFSPDRPAKSTGPTTVDAGRVLLETEAINYSYQKTGTVKTITWVGPNPQLRAGITNWLEFSANIAPWTQVTTKDASDGSKTRLSGPSDLFLRAKANLWGNEGGKTAFALSPFIKLGTAPEGIGNQATEGGIAALYTLELAKNLQLSLNSEVDYLKNNDDNRYHYQYVNIIGLSREIVKDVTLTAELWSQVNVDPSGTVKQYSFDTAIAWNVRPNVQLDLGANFGLNRDTPAIQLYAGIAQRF
jgi:Putative MetA-pathway of phenol degradation